MAKQTQPAGNKSKKSPVIKFPAGPYKGHRDGSNKGAVHFVFDEHGPEEAHKVAAARGIKESTAKQWVGSWERLARKALETSEAGKIAKDLKGVDSE